MSKILAVLLLVSGIYGFSQTTDYNTKKGYAINGYDVVSYFNNKPQEGKEELTAEHDQVRFKFVNAENRDKFLSDPDAYLPQYGGYCAYAVAVNAKKVKVDPETYEIRDGKLYLFYNKGKNNTLQFWLNESPDNLKQKADKNWQKIKR
ncbi:YHS domain-containing (seleno)protein [Flagellimonas crocea]|uniref:YHS domain-containing (seleno)protein n=1 Tax=Flagellimonas crocea TaxID=3067311 RepID=UPI002970006F|nr:YHS domain-containing (seleno)protein [Muricauda sp. DH64]